MMQLPVDLEIARGLPPSGGSLKQAESYTRWLATHHYENFTVASVFLPRHLRQHFYNVYAYCRWADDLADEVTNPSEALKLLNWWDSELHQCYAGSAKHPVFVALRGTIERFELPIEPFSDLLTAFRQDVSRDLQMDRIYIPVDLMTAHGIAESDLFAGRFDSRYEKLMCVLVDRTRELFKKGFPLAQRVAPKLRVDIELFSRGGLAVLDAIELIGYNTLQQRPSLTGVTKLKLLGRALGEYALTYARR